MKKTILFIAGFILSGTSFAGENSFDMESYSIASGVGFFVLVLIFFAVFLYRASKKEHYVPAPPSIKFKPEPLPGFNIFATPAFNGVYYALLLLVIIHAVSFGLCIL